MPLIQTPPRGRRVLGKGRMEGFSDGLFGFAVTLLVLDLAVRPPGTPLQQVLHAWPAYLTHIISFLTIGGAWLLHAGLTDQLARADQLFLRLDLLVVVFLPFPTRLVAGALHNTSGEGYVTMHGLTLLAIRLLGSALDAYARHEHLYSPHQDDQELRTDRRKLLPVVIGYAIAILTGIALPVLAVALYFGLADGVAHGSRLVRARRRGSELLSHIRCGAGLRARPGCPGAWLPRCE